MTRLTMVFQRVLAHGCKPADVYRALQHFQEGRHVREVVEPEEMNLWVLRVDVMLEEIPHDSAVLARGAAKGLPLSVMHEKFVTLRGDVHAPGTALTEPHLVTVTHGLKLVEINQITQCMNLAKRVNFKLFLGVHVLVDVSIKFRIKIS